MIVAVSGHISTRGYKGSPHEHPKEKRRLLI
jgi:hypothetical protein